MWLIAASACVQTALIIGGVWTVHNSLTSKGTLLYKNPALERRVARWLLVELVCTLFLIQAIAWLAETWFHSSVRGWAYVVQAAVAVIFGGSATFWLNNAARDEAEIAAKTALFQLDTKLQHVKQRAERDIGLAVELGRLQQFRIKGLV